MQYTFFHNVRRAFYYHYLFRVFTHLRIYSSYRKLIFEYFTNWMKNSNSVVAALRYRLPAINIF